MGREQSGVQLIELVLIALGLSMDAFAVSVSLGLFGAGKSLKKSLTAGLWFGSFQGLMPLIGFYLGSLFARQIVSVDHWIAFFLLAAIGGKALYGAIKGGEPEEGGRDLSLGGWRMLTLAVATSIDALAVGISFAFLQVEIVSAVALIAIITFLISALGVWVGTLVGARFRRWAEFFGGGILILIGLKILLEHLGIL